MIGCLCVLLQLSRERNQGRPLWSMQQLTKVLQEEEEQKPNPVTQRIKIIMVGMATHQQGFRIESCE